MEVIGFAAAEFPLMTFSGQKRRKIKIISFCYFCSYGLLFLWTFLQLRVLMLDGTARQLLSQMCVTNLIHQLYFSEIKSK